MVKIFLAYIHEISMSSYGNNESKLVSILFPHCSRRIWYTFHKYLWLTSVGDVVNTLICDQISRSNCKNDDSKLGLILLPSYMNLLLFNTYHFIHFFNICGFFLLVMWLPRFHLDFCFDKRCEDCGKNADITCVVSWTHWLLGDVVII